MSFNELNSVEHFIIQKLSGVNLNIPPPAPGRVSMPAAPPYGSFPWRYKKAEELKRPADQVMLEGKLREALIRLNPEIAGNPSFADEVIYRLRAIFVGSAQTGLVRANEEFHVWLCGEKTMPFGENNRHVPVRLIDFEDLDNNRYVITNQYAVTALETKIPDIVLLINGIPVVVGEAKTPIRPSVSWLDGAHEIHNIYENSVPQLFVPNLLSFATEGKELYYGSVRCPLDYWSPWRMEGDEAGLLQQMGQTLGLGEVGRELSDLLDPVRLLDLLRSFCVFSSDKKKRRVKILARYQQVEGTNRIVDRVLEGRLKKGLIWHFQGSGKSLLMVFAAQKLRRLPELKSPTVLVLVDRTDLDTQITGTFNAADIANTVGVESREELRRLLTQGVRKILISTIHKFGGSPDQQPSPPTPLPEGEGSQEPSPPTPLPEGEGDLEENRINYHGGFTFTGLLERARELRAKQTPAEEVFWQISRNRQFAGKKFRRQHQIGNYIVDFYCHEGQLVVEFDGPVHEERVQKDQTRDKYLQSLGITVLRFKNEVFLNDPGSVLATITTHLDSTQANHPSPTGRGDGGEGRPEQFKPWSTRKNIIVLVDEAHRTHEGDLGRRMRAALPNAFLFGLTGTPVNKADKNTFWAFGEEEDDGGYLSRYSFQDSIRDRATLPLHFEPRLVDVHVDAEKLDAAYRELTEEAALSDDQADALSKRAAQMSAFLKSPERVQTICKDIARHFQEKVEPHGFKAMVVTPDRFACVEYKRQLDALLGEKTSAVVISTNHNDELSFKQKWGLDKDAQEKLLDRFNDKNDPLKILIVTAKLLTGFDSPILQTMYPERAEGEAAGGNGRLSGTFSRRGPHADRL